VLQRNLLYTGITRGAKLTVIVGDMRAVNEAVGRTAASARKTRLQSLIREKD
jgi:exodeoxyribonuclease V alpha subunit